MIFSLENIETATKESLEQGVQLTAEQVSSINETGKKSIEHILTLLSIINGRANKSGQVDSAEQVIAFVNDLTSDIKDFTHKVPDHGVNGSFAQDVELVKARGSVQEALNRLFSTLRYQKDLTQDTL